MSIPEHRCVMAPRILHDIYYFFRVSAYGATAVLPIIGAASVERHITPRSIVGLIGVGAAFHAFAYVHNDVCDLDLDRTQALRSMYPLVNGRVAPEAALTLALACVPLAFAADAIINEDTNLRGRRRELGRAFAILAAYNLWGKRNPLPPCSDMLQGVGWACLVRYGATAVGKAPSPFTDMLAIYEVALIALVNGVHGAMRDLANDAAHGATTTAIFFGARQDGAGGLNIPRLYLLYAALLQLLLLLLPAWAVGKNLAQYSSRERLAAALLVSGLSTAILLVLLEAVKSGATAEPGMLHLLLILSVPIALVAPVSAPATGALLLALHSLPILPNSLTHAALRWAMTRGPR